MDISVSRLNKRMALQLPAEFPLGLVFVVGEVKDLSYCADGLTINDFYVEEKDHSLHCRLSPRAAVETCIADGDLIRAGGHLAFSPAHAGYYLLARDVEVLSEERQSSSPLAQIIVDQVERSSISQLEPAEIPHWVELLAPPEIQSEFSRQLSVVEKSPLFPSPNQPTKTEESVMSYPAEEPAPASLSDELVDFLSEAMDEEEDIELTPEILAKFEPVPQKRLSQKDLEVLKDLESALFMTMLPEDSAPDVMEPKRETIQQDDSGTDGHDALEGESGSSTPNNAQKMASTESNGDFSELDRTSQIQRKSSSIHETAATTKGIEMATSLPRVNIGRESGKQAAALTANQGQEFTIPWYVIAGIMALLLLFVAAFVIVALSSTALPLPFTLP